MKRLVLVTLACLVIGFQLTHAQSTTRSRSVAGAAAAPATLPVRRVVLYKNGIGYFEHIGKVRGNAAIGVDFSSSQLDDVLNSLTVLDLGNGRIGGISYNSEAPIAERLGALKLAVGERATLPQMLDALRGARIEARTGTRTVTGRLLSVERRALGTGSGVPRDELTVVSDSGEIRTVEMTPATSVRLMERESATKVGSYLSLLASARASDLRRMTISSAGTGERDLLVSYVSEAPVWKTTYRILLSREEQPQLQGWAIVDNTTGEDWNNVELSLVAGAPQSFIQQISQPQYVRRPVVEPSEAVLLTPQTHASTLSDNSSVSSGVLRGTVRDSSGGTIPGATVRVLDAQRRTVNQAYTDGRGQYVIAGLAAGAYRMEFTLEGFHTAVRDVNVSTDGDTRADAELKVGAIGETVTVTGEAPRVDVQSSSVFGGEVAVESANLGELFEYRVTTPISIPRNQSALVPIIHSAISVERVSLWNSATGARPVRALWITNTSGLTLDAGAFTVVEDGAFGGEGLIEPLKPEEKRLVSYAVDLGVQVDSRLGDTRSSVNRVVVQRGVMTTYVEQRSRRVYTIRNNDTVARTVIVEHPTQAGWSLVGSSRPIETTADAYRFAVQAPAKQTVTLTVDEAQPTQVRYQISTLTDPQLSVIVRDGGDNQIVKEAIAPILARKAAIAKLAADIASRDAQAKQIAGDQQRVRENLQSLRNSTDDRALIKRYTTQLAQQEDRLEALRSETTGLNQSRQQANAELQQLIEQLELDVRPL